MEKDKCTCVSPKIDASDVIVAGTVCSFCLMRISAHYHCGDINVQIEALRPVDFVQDNKDPIDS